MTPPIRFLAFILVLIALGSVVLDLVLIEFFGLFFLAIASMLVYVGVGLLLVLRLPGQPVGWLLLGRGRCSSFRWQLARTRGRHSFARPARCHSV